jgi:hypothetical protein
LFTIGGLVHDKAANGPPQAGIQVAIKGTGLFSTTDAQGRYVLNGLASGEHTLVAWPADGKPFEKKIFVPSSEGSYDLVTCAEDTK